MRRFLACLPTTAARRFSPKKRELIRCRDCISQHPCTSATTYSPGYASTRRIRAFSDSPSASPTSLTSSLQQPPPPARREAAAPQQQQQDDEQDELPSMYATHDSPKSPGTKSDHSHKTTSNNTNTTQQHNFNHTARNFAASWHDMVQDLIQLQPPQWLPVHSRQGQDYCKALRTHRALDRSIEAVAAGFCLLDRMATQCEWQQQQQQQSALSASNTEPWYPLDLRVLGAVVGAWKRILRKGAVQYHRGKPTEWAWSGDEILEKVQRYRTTGLIEPNAITYNVLLDAIHLCFDHQSDPHQKLQATQWGRALWQTMLDDSAGDVHDAQHHPNHTTVLNLMHLWATLRQPAAESEDLVRQLQSWYAATKRPDLKPTLKLCLDSSH